MAEAKKALQAEVVAVKTRWGAEAKLKKSDGPNAPLPLAVSRTIPRPDAAAVYDVDELTLRLWIDALEVPADGAPPVRVEVDGPLPEALRTKIAAHVLERWQAELRARGAGKGWMMEKMLGWAEGAYVDLITLDPTFVEMYDGCDDMGLTVRRYTIAEPPDISEAAPEGGGEESEEESSEEDPAARMERLKLEEEADRLQRIKDKATEEADRLYREEVRGALSRLFYSSCSRPAASPCPACAPAHPEVVPARSRSGARRRRRRRSA